MRFIIDMVGSNSLFEGLGYKEVVIETGWYKMFVDVWFKRGRMVVEYWCVLVFLEFIGLNTIDFRLFESMYLDMGYWRKKVRLKLC